MKTHCAGVSDYLERLMLFVKNEKLLQKTELKSISKWRKRNYGGMCEQERESEGTRRVL